MLHTDLFGQNSGINTLDPTAKLDINGDLRIRTLPSGSSNTDLVLVVDNDGNVKKVTLCDLQNAIYGDIKDSRQNTDHCGWYLLDGRALTSLSATAQAQALSLGFGSNLPNFTNRFVRAKQGAETMASTGGANTVTLTQANMPNFSINISTSASGNHSHDIIDRNNFNPTGVSGPFANIADNSNYNSRPANAIITTLSTNGLHNHPFNLSSNGGGESISIVPSYIAYASFVYLGL